jgi:RimJ/RimL family protein N-acetyltransferase
MTLPAPLSIVLLRETSRDELPIFFEQQLNPEVNWMADFTAKDPTDRKAFDTHWDKVLAYQNIIMHTILFDGEVAGSVLSHAWGGESGVRNWLGRVFWSKGIASKALVLFLQVMAVQPLFAR